MGKIDSIQELSKLMDTYQDLVFSICLKMTNDYFASEDLCQETFLSAFKNLEQFDGQNEKSWICRIATNKCIDYQRQSARRMVPAEEEVLKEYPSAQGLPEKEFLEGNVYEELTKVCRGLKPPYGKIAEMYFVEEKGAAEISALTGVSQKTVQTQIYRARAMLRRIYRKGAAP
ncbi:MAG: RNA polymerase sigma factor [Lachnospiraceae bacterium]